MPRIEGRISEVSVRRRALLSVAAFCSLKRNDMNVSMTLDIVPMNIGTPEAGPDYKSIGNATTTNGTSINSTTLASLTPLVAAVIGAQDADEIIDSMPHSIQHMPLYVVKRQTLEEGRADINRHFVEIFNSRYSQFFTMESIDTGVFAILRA